ncbi:hypothetical protein WR25_03636 [Diploscapter pachys]|uniref:Vacuolar ATPase assembly integral membrane protein VMA21 homolog n=1 Tax=Diploscapter pachys TaxID=2018661 RepID=A0A2A2KMX4_9BILA|nr:hypothetical protein WR25_03636 [Diploscapter pachys]
MNELIPNLTERRVQGQLKSLAAYSLLVLLVPLGSMFFLKKFFFEAFLSYSPNDALTYSAVIAIILVHVVVVLWVFTATGGEEDKKGDKKD